MPQIPLPGPAPVDQISARVGAPQSEATSEAFGGAAGTALEGLGGAIGALGQSIGGLADVYQKRKDATAVATATANTTFTPQYNDIVNGANPDGSGLVAATQTQGMKFVDDKVAEFAKTGASPAAINAYRLNLLNMQGQHVQNAATQADKMANDNAKLDVDKGLATQLNDIVAGGAIDQPNFDARLKIAHDSVDNAPGLNADQKKQLKQNWDQSAVAGRFDAALSAAEKSSDPAAVQAVIDDINKPYWRDKFDANTLDGKLKVLTQTQAAVEKLRLGNAADSHLNAIRADPSSYQKQTAAALDAFNKTTNMTGLDKTQEQARIRSNAAAMYFEGKGEKAETPADIDALIKEMNTGFKEELSSGAFDAETSSLLQKKNLLQQNENSVTTKALGVQKEVLTRNEETVNVLATNLLAKAGKMPLEDAELNDLNQKAQALETQELAIPGAIGGIKPELDQKIRDIFTTREAFRLNTNQPASHTVKYLYENMTGARSKWSLLGGPDDPNAPATDAGGGGGPPRTPEEANAALKAAGGAVPAGAGGAVAPKVAPGTPAKIAGSVPDMQRALSDPWTGRRIGYTADNGVVVTAPIQDHTNMMGMQPRAYVLLNGGVAAAGPAGVARIEITAGKGGGHLSHMAGTAMDVVGYQDKAGKILWNNAQKVAFLRGVAGAGGNRFGLYENANDVHIDYAHGGFPAAVWGAGGLVKGDASRNFRDPDFKAFADQYAAGTIATNRDTAIVPYDSNAVHIAAGKYATTGDITDNMPRFMQAIGQMETSNRPGAYSLVVNPSEGGKAALGRYGILLENVGDWSERVLGHRMTPTEFLNDSKAQDDIFKGMFGMYVRKYGPEGAARAWLGGEGSVHNAGAADKNGTTVGGYGARFTALMGGHSAYDSSPSATGLEAASHAQLIQAQTATAVMAQNQTAMSNGNFINFVADSMHVPSAILTTDAGYDQRAQDYEAGKRTFQPTAAQSTPFSPDEVAANEATLKSGDAQRILQMAMSINRWPQDMREDAYRQMGERAPTEVMAARYASRGDTSMALSQIRGDIALQANPEPVWKNAFNNAWSSSDGMGDLLRGTTDIGLNNLKVGLQGSLRALYMDKYGPSHTFNQAELDQLAAQALGRSIGVVNGTRTLMPAGVDDRQFSQFMETADWQKVSMTQTPPQGADASGKPHILNDYDMSRMHPINVGSNVYKFVNDDAQFAKTIVNGDTVIDYQAVLDAPTIKETLQTAKPPAALPPGTGAAGARSGGGVVDLLRRGAPDAATRESAAAAATPGTGGVPVVPGSLEATPEAAAAAAAAATAPPPVTAPGAPAPTPAATPAPAPEATPQTPTPEQQARIDAGVAEYLASIKRTGGSIDPATEKVFRETFAQYVLSGQAKPSRIPVGRAPLRK